MTALDYFSDAESHSRLQVPRIVRCALLGYATFALVWAIAVVLRSPPSAEQLGALVIVVLPELGGSVLAWRMWRQPVSRRAVLGVLGVEIALAVADLGSGSPLGFVQIIGPVVLTVLVVRDRTPDTWAAARPIRLRLRPADGADEKGGSFVEFAALVVVASLILGSLTVLGVGVPSKVSLKTDATICHVFRGDCTKEDAAAAGTDKNDGSGGHKSECHGFVGFFKCLGKGIAGFFKGVGQAIAGIFKGIGQMITDPVGFFKGIGYAITHPGDAIKAMFGDAIGDFKNGNIAEGIGNLIGNLGSMAIPGADAADALGALGKLGKLGKAGKAGKGDKDGKSGGKNGPGKDITPDKAADNTVKDGDDALAAAEKGDAAGADKAAKQAGDDLKKAEDAAKSQGCPAALGDPRNVPPIQHLGRFGAIASPVCGALRSVIDKAKDAKAIAQEAADRARIVNQINDKIRNGRYEDADNLIDGLRADARKAEQRESDRPSSQNQRAAEDARRAFNDANRRSINSKVDDARSAPEGSDKRAEGDVGEALRNNLVNFEKKYGPNGRDGEIDAETDKAIIEVANGTKLRGKTTQITRNQNSSTTNPDHKPLIVYAPRMKPNAVKALQRDTGVTVVRTTDDLKNALRDLGESI